MSERPRRRTTTTTVQKRQQQRQRGNTQARVGLVGMRVTKVERRVRALMTHPYAQGGLFAGIAALQEAICIDLLTRANAHREQGAQLSAIHVALALQEPGCLASRLTRCSRVGGVYLPSTRSNDIRQSGNIEAGKMGMN